MMVYNDKYLAHYGVKGMRWGVRNFQDSNGHLTKEGRQRYKAFKKEVKADNLAAKTLGLEATNYGYAAKRTIERAEKSKKKVDKALSKDPLASKKSTIRKIKDKEAKKEAAESLTKEYLQRLMTVGKHADTLIAKYGSEHVIKPNYKEVKFKGDKSGKKVPILHEYETGKNAVATILSGFGAVAMASITGFGVGYLFSDDNSKLLSDIAINQAKQKQKKEK